MATYGYARVSTKDQNVNRQLDALERFPLQRSSIYIDYYTGADYERPEYQRLVRRLEQGNVLVVKSIDRLGRNYGEILAQWDRLTRSQGVQVVVLDMPLLDTRQTARDLTGTFIADVVLQLLSYVAQVERENIRQRQAEGIAAAKARGVRFGRPEKARPQEYADVRSLVAMGELSHGEAVARLGVCRSTFEKWLRQDRRGGGAPGTDEGAKHGAGGSAPSDSRSRAVSSVARREHGDAAPSGCAANPGRSPKELG
ncbi:recombinase family protein [Collinsella intestinalis]|uniref:recombinase family protein n=1 Tax=Collinsella intestinalis TaxID=147207 RepID=UPI00195834AA|nr:recombinase family protein [Collinsella intestinalis]MBM6683911.1 recombinase family protein [Collinsella intestinalis]